MGAEGVRPLLLDQGCTLPLPARRGELASRRLLLAYLPFDHLLADLHAQVIDRGIVGQREEVGAFEPLVAGIEKALPDRSPDGVAGDPQQRVGRLQRRHHRPVAADEDHAAALVGLQAMQDPLPPGSCACAAALVATTTSPSVTAMPPRRR